MIGCSKTGGQMVFGAQDVMEKNTAESPLADCTNVRVVDIKPP